MTILNRIIISVLLLALCVSINQVMRVRRELDESMSEPMVLNVQHSSGVGLASDLAITGPEVRPPTSESNAAEPVIDVPTSTVVLSIRIDGVRPHEGELHIAIFDAASVFPDRSKALRVKSVLPVQNEVQAQVLDLPHGDYATAVFQDSNGDGMLNRNAFGIPVEPYGFSNDARGRFGPPAYSAAVVRTTSGKAVHQVTLR